MMKLEFVKMPWTSLISFGLIVVPCHSCHGQIQSALAEADLEIPVKYLWEIVADALVVE